MLSKFDKERLKMYVGPQYGLQLCQRLQRKGITNRHGRPYSSTAVRTIINSRNDRDIEQTAIELIAESELQKKIAQQLQHLQQQKHIA